MFSSFHCEKWKICNCHKTEAQIVFRAVLLLYKQILPLSGLLGYKIERVFGKNSKNPEMIFKFKKCNNWKFQKNLSNLL